MKSEIQSVLINKKFYSFKEALKKLLEMGFKYKKVDITKNFYRFRQTNPDKYKKFRIKKINKEIEFVIGFL